VPATAATLLTAFPGLWKDTALGRNRLAPGKIIDRNSRRGSSHLKTRTSGLHQHGMVALHCLP